MKIRSLTFLCILVLLSQLLLVNCNQHEEGKQKKENKEKPQDAGKQKGTGKGERKQVGADQNEKGQRPNRGKGVHGKFSSKDKAECTWSVTGEDTVHLKVECTQGNASFWCVFAGNPSSCMHFKADSKSYWKQIGRAVKKQKQLCKSPKSVLKSKVCKKGPQEAHLSLTSSSLVKMGNLNKDEATAHEKAKPHNAEPMEKDLVKDDTKCSEDEDPIDQKKLAEEYCGKTWGSVCTVFFSMVQSKKC
ncbi:fibroblast growth factor-binding protein 1 [Rhinatrema bivittatum]|uniref:fibroblast growth factor-binding protein 1 n=1 Tax=Rhinatrema bivittatum TaxID=194408 RepID=UPI0011267B5F|nr:fibroblast growth factor-binding protein 1 [Rhinatrema bivittatum]XP_029446546.1 fibroblast growth factor-binding protein 1 [Rhinatrema bivittatum]